MTNLSHLRPQTVRVWFIPILIASAFLSAWLGLLLGSLGDLLFLIDTQILGITLGAALGSALPLFFFAPRPFVASASAALGAALVLLLFVGIARTAPFVLVGIVGASALLSAMFAIAMRLFLRSR